MNSFVRSLMLLALLTSSITEAGHLRSRRSSPSRRHSENSEQPRIATFSSNSSPSLWSNHELNLMAGEIHSLLSDAMEHSEDSISLQQDLSGLAVHKTKKGCPLKGNIQWNVASVAGLDSFTTTHLELVDGSEEYTPVKDFRGRIKGYKFEGLWQMTAVLDETLRIGVTTQTTNVRVCDGAPMDVTSRGRIEVNATVVEAALRIEGFLDTTSDDVTIEDATVVQKKVHFDTPSSNLGGLVRAVPLDYTEQLETLIQSVFTTKLNELEPHLKTASNSMIRAAAAIR